MEHEYINRSMNVGDKMSDDIIYQHFLKNWFLFGQQFKLKITVYLQRMALAEGIS